MATITDALPRFAELADRLRRALDASGAVTDDASPTLARLRREIRERRRHLASEPSAPSRAATPTGSSPTTTSRSTRPLRPAGADRVAEPRARNRPRPLAAGQTLFIEPEQVVDPNNDLVQATREEEHETARILAELTAAVHARLDDLDTLVSSIGELDWIFARAQAAERMGATAPAIDAGRTVELRGARHPLLLAQSWKDPSRTVVPMDLELGPERPLLVITGPNAGGKTIALKTLAVQALRAQVGCHVPADEGSRLPVFDDVSRSSATISPWPRTSSTFSAFVKQAREILERADQRSLVLLDEPRRRHRPRRGRGPRPGDLEELAERGALVIATTHLEPLKAFASTHPRARNASVEFDTATLAPTFHLRYDQPGQSYALTIAARLGLGAELIARECARFEHAARLADLLATLDANARTEAERAREIERIRTEAARPGWRRPVRPEAAAESRPRRSSPVPGPRRPHSLARSAARSLPSGTSSSARTGRAARSTRAGAGCAMSPAGWRRSYPRRRRAVAGPGATVVAEHLGIRGELVEIAGSSATVRSGSVTVRVPLQVLRAVAASAATPAGEAARGAGRSGFRGAIRSRLRIDRSRARSCCSGRRPTRRAIGREISRRRLPRGPRERTGLVHGKGSGALRKAVRDLLAGHPLVESFRDGEPSGGTGATVAALKVG